MRVILYLLMIGLVPASLAQQTEHAEVLATVQRFLGAMESGDIDAARDSVRADGRFYALREDGQTPVLRTFTAEQALQDWSEQQDQLQERIWQPEVKIYRGLATVWTPYEFYRNGSYSHCGINVFNLIRLAQGWRLVGGIYTVEQECASKPPDEISSD